MKLVNKVSRKYYYIGFRFLVLIDIIRRTFYWIWRKFSGAWYCNACEEYHSGRVVQFQCGRIIYKYKCCLEHTKLEDIERYEIRLGRCDVTAKLMQQLEDFHKSKKEKDEEGGN